MKTHSLCLFITNPFSIKPALILLKKITVTSVFGFKQRMLPVIARKQVDLYSRNFIIGTDFQLWNTYNSFTPHHTYLCFQSLQQQGTYITFTPFYLVLHIIKSKKEWIWIWSTQHQLISNYDWTHLMHKTATLVSVPE